MRSVEFKNPEYIPCRVIITWPIWNTYRKKLKEIAVKHQLLFPDFKSEMIQFNDRIGVLRDNRLIKDPFGCIWRFTIKGLSRTSRKAPA